MKNEFDYLNDVRVDFSKYNNIELTEQECINMKKALKEKTRKRISWKKCAVIAACAASIAVVAQTSFAQDFIGNVIKSISTGYNTFFVEEKQENDELLTMPVPEELAGQIYDKDGNVLTELSSDIDAIYDKDGYEVMISSKANGEDEPEITLKRVKGAGEIPESDENVVVYTSLEDMKEILNFAPKIPEYLPEGYSLLYAEGYRTETGGDKVSGDYLMLSYSNGKNKFSIHERVINKNTKFETGGDFTVGEINGYTAAIADDEVSWEADGISVSVLGARAVKGSELIKVAESVK